MKKFRINDNWDEAIKYGWNCGIGWAQSQEELKSTKKAKAFIKKELPKILSDFYQNIVDKLAKTMDEDMAVVICEEHLATNLEAIIIELAGAIDSDLLQVYK